MGQPFSPGSPQDIEAALLEQLRAAQQQRRAAARHRRELIEELKNARWVGDADTSQELNNAANAENHALEQYAKALAAFTDLILRGRLPGKDNP